MEVAYEILIDGLKKYGAEIIGGGLFFVTLWLWRRYQKKIISGLKFMLLFVIAVIVAIGLYAVVSFLGGAFLLGFVSAGMIGLVIWAVNMFKSEKPEEEYDIIKGIPINELPLVEMLIANLFEGNVRWDNSSDIDIYNPFRDWNRKEAIYWLERAAEHGYPKAQQDLIRKVYEYSGSMRDDAKAYMWAYIGDLYEEYEKNLRVVDVDIRRTKIYKGASKYTLEFIHTSDLQISLSKAQKEAAKEEAKARFEKMRKFMDAQIEAKRKNKR